MRCVLAFIIFLSFSLNNSLAADDYYIHGPNGSLRHCSQDGNDIYCDDQTSSGGATLDQMRRAGYVTKAEADQQRATAVGNVLAQVVQGVQKKAQDRLSDIMSDAKIDPTFQFVSTKVFIADDGNLDSRIAYSHLVPLLRQKGYQFVLLKNEADLAAWAGIKNQADKGYITMNLYFLRANSNETIIDAFAAKKIDRIDQSELIKILCYEIVKKLPNPSR